MNLKKFITSSLLAVTVATSISYPDLYGFHLSSKDREYISNFLQNHFSYDELVGFIQEVERGDNLEDKYSHEELVEIKEFLSYLAHLGTLTNDETTHTQLNEKILDLLSPEEDEYEEYEDYEGSICSVSEWYHQVYFPNQIPKQEITLCKSIIKKAASNTWYYGKKYTKKVVKESGKGCKKVGKGAKKVYKKITGKSKKGWKKTKKFVQENKKAILIGLAVVAIVSVAIIFAPEISSLLAALMPAAANGDKRDTQVASSYDQSGQVQANNTQSFEENVETVSYTEENLFEDCIEMVQEGLLASGINNILVDDTVLSKALDQVKGVSSMLCHELISVLDVTISHYDVLNQLQLFNQLNFDQQKIQEINSSFESLKQKFNTQLEDCDIERNIKSKRMIDYLHQKTDEVFGTSIASLYSPEALAARDRLILKLEVPLPNPGGVVGSSVSKNQLKKFTENNYRRNLKALSPQKDYSSIHAHHVFPQAFKEYFIEKGINIHDPKVMTWWEESTHLPQAKSYNDAWLDFIKKNPGATKEQVLENGKKIMKNFGKEVNY